MKKILKVDRKKNQRNLIRGKAVSHRKFHSFNDQTVHSYRKVSLSSRKGVIQNEKSRKSERNSSQRLSQGLKKHKNMESSTSHRYRPLRAVDLERRMVSRHKSVFSTLSDNEPRIKVLHSSPKCHSIISRNLDHSYSKKSQIRYQKCLLRSLKEYKNYKYGNRNVKGKRNNIQTTLKFNNRRMNIVALNKKEIKSCGKVLVTTPYLIRDVQLIWSMDQKQKARSVDKRIKNRKNLLRRSKSNKRTHKRVGIVKERR